ncbi:hypothetical protein BST92_01205 [Nonlabens arenilitoris]|uniref:Outer membrane protein beta-barrel domain-containing protein n=1 Tax=Nonlabens arenilitoris TaxID=1217969 RepID=A0A2S7U6K1_9FLAO|nr:hypothetical protein [Nonlabens arenilitoris]PQJ30636.1 hypothetical protein BST92_01205 [Nonlabens arenilitoris]
MKSIAICIIALFVSLCCLAQNNDATSSDELNINQNIPYVKIGAGYWVPTKNLSRFLNNAPFFELGVVVPDDFYNRSFELGIQLVIPDQENYFLLRDNNLDFEIEATTILNAYLKLNKYIWESDQNRVELSFGLGISSIFLDPVTRDGDAVLDYDNINSFLVAPGLSYTLNLKDKSLIQISLEMHYTPFKMERGTTKDLDSFSLLPKISYRF